MNFIQKTLIVSSLLFATNTYALLLVEPHIGLNLSGTGHNSLVPAKTFQYTGGQYGLKLGAKYMQAMAGLDYNHSSFDLMTSGYSNSFTRNEWGFFVGYNFPAIARVWTTYYFSNSGEAQSASNLIAKGDKYDGHTFELGGGYSGFPYVSLNFMYRIIVLTEYTTSSGTSSLTGNTEVNNHEIVLGISSPFDFF